MSPVFRTPIVHDAPATSWEQTAEERAFWRFYNGRARGQTILKIGGVYSEVTTPTQEQIDSCDLVLTPNGTYERAAYLGGRDYTVTSAEATALTAAGYGSWIVG